MKPLSSISTGLLAVTLLAACGKGEQTLPPPSPAAVGAVTKLDVAVGIPPASGWRWAVAQFDTTVDASDGPHAHDFSWLFFVADGSMEITVAGERKMVSKGEALFIPAGQEHAHRYSPNSRVLFFQLRPADDPPGALHRGRQLFSSESPLNITGGRSHTVRAREFTIPAGGRTAEAVAQEPNVGYVIEGKLTRQTGADASTLEAGSPFSLPLNARYVLSNGGTTRLRLILVDVRPSP